MRNISTPHRSQSTASDFGVGVVVRAGEAGRGASGRGSELDMGKFYFGTSYPTHLSYPSYRRSL